MAHLSRRCLSCVPEDVPTSSSSPVVYQDKKLESLADYVPKVVASSPAIGNGAESSNSSHHNRHHNASEAHCSTCTCHIPTPEEAAPKWSFHKRVLPSTPSLLAFSSPEGKSLFRETLQNQACEAYFPLSEQFVTQSEPAYCGLTTLVMVLNALSIDPNVRWRGGWRWFDEEVLINGCCIHMETVKRVGITLDQFVAIARCNGAKVLMRRPGGKLRPESERQTSSLVDPTFLGADNAACKVWDEHAFRSEIRQMTTHTNGFLVVSFSRSALGQTGDGHFSPIAAYHEERDMALVLDVARFKYAPYWCSVKDLYQAMIPVDGATKKARGWCLVYPQVVPRRDSEKQRPGELVAPSRKVDGSKYWKHSQSEEQSLPLRQNSGICPVGEIKVEYCSFSPKGGRVGSNGT